MKSLWRIRPSYFVGRGSHNLTIDGEPFEFVTDDSGCFEVIGEPPAGLGIFANRLDGDKQTHLVGRIFEPTSGRPN